jgi:hypothetical protein
MNGYSISWPRFGSHVINNCERMIGMTICIRVKWAIINWIGIQSPACLIWIYQIHSMIALNEKWTSVRRRGIKSDHKRRLATNSSAVATILRLRSYVISKWIRNLYLAPNAEYQLMECDYCSSKNPSSWHVRHRTPKWRNQTSTIRIKMHPAIMTKYDEKSLVLRCLAQNDTLMLRLDVLKSHQWHLVRHRTTLSCSDWIYWNVTNDTSFGTEQNSHAPTGYTEKSPMTPRSAQNDTLMLRLDILKSHQWYLVRHRTTLWSSLNPIAKWKMLTKWSHTARSTTNSVSSHNQLWQSSDRTTKRIHYNRVGNYH